MRVSRLYGTTLRLYPADYASRFAPEMRAAFDAASRDARRRGADAYLAFVMAEMRTLLVGVCREWAAKLGADPAARARTFPDCRRMRPAGVTRAEWAAGLDDGV